MKFFKYTDSNGPIYYGAMTDIIIDDIGGNRLAGQNYLTIYGSSIERIEIGAMQMENVFQPITHQEFERDARFLVEYIRNYRNMLIGHSQIVEEFERTFE